MKSHKNRPLMLAIATLFNTPGAHGADLDQQVLPEVRVKTAAEKESTDYRVHESASLKFTAPLIDTPQTISVIPNAVFLEQGAQNLTDVLRNTPGITFSAGENGFASNTANFNMRGFDTTGSIFMDNVRDSGNYYRDIFNLEQVEVVKGPAADNGRGTAGGYINLVTKTPHEVAAINGLANFGVDEYDSKVRGRMAVDVNQPFLETGAVRLNAMWQDGGVPGRAVAERQSWGLAPSIAFGLGTPTRFIAAYQHTEQDDLPDWGVPAALIKGMMRFDPNLDSEALRDKFYGLASDYDQVFQDSVLARIEHDFSPNLKLSNQTRWSQTDREAAYTMPTGYAPATQLTTTQLQAYARENLSVSNLTNLSASFMTGAFHHNVSVGIEYAHEESTANRFGTQTNPGTGSPIDIRRPVSNRAASSFLTPTETSKVQIDTVAGYAYDTMEINEQWQITGGLRVEYYEVEIDSRAADGRSLLSDDYNQNRTTANGKLGVVYKPVENGSIYVSGGVSALPPGSFLSNPDISREGDNAFPGFSTGMNSASVETQYAVNYEVGTKWEFFDDQLIATAALFHTERRNVAVTGKDPNDPRSDADVPIDLLGYGKQIVQGIELGLAGRITPEWQIFSGIVFMDSERVHSAFLDAGRRRASPNDYGDALTTSGDELAFTPNITANLWTTYRLPFGLTLGGGMQYVGDSYAGRPDDAERIIPNGTFGVLPGYFSINTMLEYEATKAVTLRLNVDNLTNELNAISTNWPAQRVFLGPSRNFLLSANIRF